MNQDGHWTPPPHRVLKFNTDGSSRGNPGPTGIPEEWLIAVMVMLNSFSQYIRVITLTISLRLRLFYMLWNNVACEDRAILSVSLIPKW